MMWAGMGVMAVVGTLIVLLPLVRAKATQLPPSRKTSTEHDAEFYAQRRAELDQELGTGLLSAAAHAEAVQELGHNFLSEVDPASAAATEPGTLQSVGPESSNASGKYSAALISIGFLAVLAWVYLQVGSPDGEALRATAGILEQRDVDAPTLASWRETLKSRVAKKVDDPQSWYLLGHVHLREQHFGLAEGAFAQASRAHGAADPNIDLAWLQAGFLAGKGQLSAQGMALAKRILQAQPNQSLALEILAAQAFRDQDFKQVVSLLNRALQNPLPLPQRASLQLGLVQARERMGVIGPTLDINIEGLQSAPASATLFVLARPVGARMPLAVVRRPGPDFPAQVRLDDAVSMNPAAPLSASQEVEVVVRLSLTGNVAPGPGDWQWQSGPLALVSEPIKLSAVMAPPGTVPRAGAASGPAGTGD